jgi:hypothetical protein
MGFYIFFSGQNGKKSVYTSLVLHDMYYFILNMFLEITIFIVIFCCFGHQLSSLESLRVGNTLKKWQSSESLI